MGVGRGLYVQAWLGVYMSCEVSWYEVYIQSPFFGDRKLVEATRPTLLCFPQRVRNT